MEGGVGGYRIEYLNDANYHTWKENIQMVLCLKDLESYIEDDPPSPEDVEGATRSAADIEKWHKSDRKAKALIRLSLSKAHVELTRGIKTAKGVWESIQNHFERHTLLNMLAARRNFYTATMQEGEKVIDFINRVRTLASTLESMDITIADKEMAMAVLNGLPDSFDHRCSWK